MESHLLISPPVASSTILPSLLFERLIFGEKEAQSLIFKLSAGSIAVHMINLPVFTFVHSLQVIWERKTI